MPSPALVTAAIAAAAIAAAATGLPHPAAVCEAAPTPEAAPARTPPAADRAAILAMAGAFDVSFRFEETVAIAPDYTVRPPYTTDATELVLVVADEGDFISLQHVLVVATDDSEPQIVKHWRQDWRYQDTDVLAFRGHATWQRERRAADEVRGTWTQAVFQTTDAPRYESVGRWTHVASQSSWTSELTWRPLPRRERRRDDYDVVVCRNRHTITPAGWVHEQHNQKLDLTDDGAVRRILAHEVGINTYERVDSQAVAAAASYWTEHAAAWADVRSAWSPLLERERLSVRREVDGLRLDSVIRAAVADASTRDALPRRLAAFISD